jgi:uncharacterized protein (TIGR02996 family)
MTDQEHEAAFRDALRIDPEDEGRRLVFADWLEENAAPAATVAALRAGRIPLDEMDRQAVKLLSGVTYLPGSYAKRFARDVQSITTMTPKQYRFIWHLAYRFRRQIKSMAVNAEALRCGPWKYQLEQGRSDSRAARKAKRVAPAFRQWEGLIE